MIKILIVDDQQIIRQALHRRLELELDFTLVGEARDGSEVFDLVEKLNPDIVLMDISMPQLDGITATHLLKLSGVSCRVIMLSIHDEHFMQALAYEAGASAFVAKQGVARLLATIREVASRQEIVVSS
jgi:DNA-binding NarL/FixJ family response regulator